MNKENVLKLANLLDAIEEDRFDMGGWNCGTAACIGGWAEALAADEEREARRSQPLSPGQVLLSVYAFDTESINPDAAEGEAAKWLGVDLPWAKGNIFYVMNGHASYYVSDPKGFYAHKFISSKRAAAVLRHWAVTGDLDWSVQGLSHDEPA